MFDKLSVNNNNNFNNFINLPWQVKKFCITKTNLTVTYDSGGYFRIPNYVTTNIDWELEATVSYNLWVKLKPFTETKKVKLKCFDINENFGVTEVTFILKGFSKETPTFNMLSEGYILS